MKSWRKGAPDTYLKGFNSLEAVRIKAIPASQFAARAKAVKIPRLDLLHDQLPKTPDQIGLSESAQKIMTGKPL